MHQHLNIDRTEVVQRGGRARRAAAENARGGKDKPDGTQGCGLGRESC